MNALETIVSVVIVSGAMLGGANYLDDKHADKKQTKAELSKKVDLKTIQAMQQTITLDKISELEIKEFQLTDKASRVALTDFEKFQLTKTQARLKQLRDKSKDW